MDAQTFVREAQAAGLTLTAKGETLLVSPASRLTDTQRQFIRRHKPALLRALAGTPLAGPEPEVIAATAAQALPVPWDAIRDRIQAGWRAEFSPPDAEGCQAIHWHPPGEWTPEPLPRHEPAAKLEFFQPLDDAALRDLVFSVARANRVDPAAVWVWLSQDDIEALRSGDPAETQAFRAAVASACAGGRLVPDGGHNLPVPWVNSTNGHQIRSPCADKQLSTAVRCGDCRHFIPDQIGDPDYGVGRCRVLAKIPGDWPAYPRISRRCRSFEPEEAKARPP